MADISLEIELTTINCGKCGGTYALNRRYHKHCQDYGRSWTCPYCQCGWGFSGNSELERIRKNLNQEISRHDQTRAALSQSREKLKHTESQRRAEKAAKTRIKNRVSKGVCPCCNRSFVNLKRHMQTKHPEYVESK